MQKPLFSQDIQTLIRHCHDVKIVDQIYACHYLNIFNKEFYYRRITSLIILILFISFFFAFGNITLLVNDMRWISILCFVSGSLFIPLLLAIIKWLFRDWYTDRLMTNPHHKELKTFIDKNSAECVTCYDIQLMYEEKLYDDYFSWERILKPLQQETENTIIPLTWWFNQGGELIGITVIQGGIAYIDTNNRILSSTISLNTLHQSEVFVNNNNNNVSNNVSSFSSTINANSNVSILHNT